MARKMQGYLHIFRKNQNHIFCLFLEYNNKMLLTFFGFFNGHVLLAFYSAQSRASGISTIGIPRSDVRY
jgi:hypothetical protein